MNTPHSKDILLNTKVAIQYCSICYEDVSLSQISNPLHCNHTFCRDCVLQYLNSKISDLKVLNIPCPSSECSLTFNDKNLEKVLDTNTFQTYQKIVLKKIMSRDNETKFCPMPGCSKKIKFSTKLPYTTCVCESKVCNVCCGPWHEGKTCLEAIDPAFESYAEEHDIKFCMMCKSHIEKTEGCKHMTCPICDYEWCWDCGQVYSDNHQSKCEKVWCPIPPDMPILAKMKMIWRDSSTLKKTALIALVTLLAPLIIIGVALFWPLWMYYDPKKDLSMKTPFKSIGIVLGSIFLGIIFLPLAIIAGTIMGISYVICLPCTWFRTSEEVVDITQQSENLQLRDKRWEAGVRENFKFEAKINKEEDLEIPFASTTLPPLDLEQGVQFTTDWSSPTFGTPMSF